MKFLKYFYMLLAVVCAAILCGCGSSCGTTQDAIYTFPNQSMLYGELNVIVEQGTSSSPIPLNLKGGNPTLSVTLSTSLPDEFSLQLNNKIESCIGICSNFFPSTLNITTGVNESSSSLTINSGRLVLPGKYKLNLVASYDYNGSIYNNIVIGTISITVTQNNTPIPTPSENGVFIQNGTPSIQSGFIYATQPSESNWQWYQSGTTAGISAVATNNSATLAVHSSASGESAGFILSNNLNGRFINNNTSNLEQNIGTLANSVAVSINSGFVIYAKSNSAVYFVNNYGVSSDISSQFTGITIDTIANLNGVLYAYDSTNNKVLSSNNGTSWALVSGSSVPAVFNKVVALSGDVYAAVGANGIVYLGNSAGVITNQQSLSYNAQQIAAYNNILSVAEVMSNGDATARFYHPNSNIIGNIFESMSINFTQYIPGADSSLVNSYNIGQLFLTDKSIYAIGNAVFIGDVTKLSAAIAGDYTTGKSAIASLTDVTNNANKSTVSSLLDSRLLLANTNVGIQGKIINDVSNPSSANNGSLTIVKGVNYGVVGDESNVAVSYDNLPTGNKYVQFMGVSGRANYFVIVTKNGGVVSYFDGKFVVGSTILNDTVSPSVSDTINGVSSVAYTSVAYASATNAQAAGSGNLYYSKDNGMTWLTIKLNDMPRANSQNVLVGATVASSGNTYLITTYDANNNQAVYQSATPSSFSTWQNITNSNANSLIIGLNNHLFAFVGNSSALSRFVNNSWTSSANKLPVAFESTQSLPTQNIAYGEFNNDFVYAIAESNGASIYEQQNIVDNLWQQQNVAFYVNNALFPSKTFSANPALVWSGKVWLINDNASFIYSSSDMINYYVSSINNDGNSWFVGVPVLF